MWRPDSWEEHFKKDNPDLEFREVFDLGADAMHTADLKWLKDHIYLLKCKEGEMEMTIRVKIEDWQAFTGGEIV